MKIQIVIQTDVIRYLAQVLAFEMPMRDERRY